MSEVAKTDVVQKLDTSGITDGRQLGDYCTRYPASAWMQIFAELFVLIALVCVGVGALFAIGYDLAGREPTYQGTVARYFDLPRQRMFLVWVCVGLAGILGGAAFSLKWLYHSVAKRIWNRDRILWRITVPVISGLLAPFLAFMIVSGIVPFLSGRSFDNFYVALGFGFFTGYFSDNVLAALHRLAKNIFGTVDKPPSAAETTPRIDTGT